MKNKNHVKSLKPLVLLTQLGFNMVMYPLVGLFIGKFFDNLFDKKNLFALILLVLGFIAGFRMMIKSLKGLME